MDGAAFSTDWAADIWLGGALFHTCLCVNVIRNKANYIHGAVLERTKDDFLSDLLPSLIMRQRTKSFHWVRARLRLQLGFWLDSVQLSEILDTHNFSL